VFQRREAEPPDSSFQGGALERENPACKAGFRGSPRPECIRSAGIERFRRGHVALVRLSAKILPGRQDLPFGPGEIDASCLGALNR